MRIKNAIIMVVLILPIGVFGQTEMGATQSTNSINSVDQNFENYCQQNSISYIDIAEGKVASVTFSGELTSLEHNSNATYVDYGIQLKEEETQYFKLVGSNKILSVKSLFVLRLNFDNSIK